MIMQNYIMQNYIIHLNSATFLLPEACHLIIFHKPSPGVVVSARAIPFSS